MVISLPHGFDAPWWLLLDTVEDPATTSADARVWTAPSYPLQGRSVALLSRSRPLQ